MNMTEQITSIGRKVEAAYQTLIAVAEDREFRGIKMQAIWTLIQTCITPIVTYASETWHINKQETKKLNQILDKVIRRVLMTPDATPREAIYIDTGLLDVYTISDSKRLNMKARLNRDKSELMAKILDNPQCMWEADTKTTMERNNITADELKGSRYQTKVTIKRATTKAFEENLKKSAEGKSKMNYFLESREKWTPGIRAKYMDELTRKQTSMIFKARSGMLQVKGNYKNGYTDLTCRKCKGEEETQQHIMEECPEIHSDEAIKVPKQQIFTEDTGTLKQTAEKINKIMDKLSEVVC